jgi:hypothetical protein
MGVYSWAFGRAEGLPARGQLTAFSPFTSLAIGSLLFAGMIVGFFGTLKVLTQLENVTVSPISLVVTNACALGSDNAILLQMPFQRVGKHGFAVSSLPKFNDQSDNSESPRRSSAVLCEDGQAIGHGHSAHAEIAQKGSGNYSHWSGTLYFSSSDNSDPNTNGRRYKLAFPRS